jgi:hypothetical protein
VDGKMGKIWDGGRDLEGSELVVEYCDKRFLEACDMGRGRLLLRADGGGDVISGGRAGCAEFTVMGDGMGGGEVAGVEPGDMTAVIVWGSSAQRIAKVGFALSPWLAGFQFECLAPLWVGPPSTPAQVEARGCKSPCPASLKFAPSPLTINARDRIPYRYSAVADGSINLDEKQ